MSRLLSDFHCLCFLLDLKLCCYYYYYWRHWMCLLLLDWDPCHYHLNGSQCYHCWWGKDVDSKTVLLSLDDVWMNVVLLCHRCIPLLDSPSWVHCFLYKSRLKAVETEAEGCLQEIRWQIKSLFPCETYRTISVIFSDILGTGCVITLISLILNSLCLL